jgi:hypothetical protein
MKESSLRTVREAEKSTQLEAVHQYKYFTFTVKIFAKQQFKTAVDRSGEISF